MNVVKMYPMKDFTAYNATTPPHTLAIVPQTTDTRAGFYVDGHQLERFALNCPQQAIARSETLAAQYRRDVDVWLRAFDGRPLRLCSVGRAS